MAFPHSLATFYTTGRYGDAARRFANDISDKDRLARHVWAVIYRGIQEEARLNGGTNLQAGGGIDVIIVDANGARMHQL